MCVWLAQVPLVDSGRLMKPIFESDRLAMCDWSVEDAEAAFAIYGDPEVTVGLSGEPIPNVAAMRERLAKIEEKYGPLRPFGFWVMRLKSDESIVGSVLLQPLPEHEEIEVGWHLSRPNWGHGYASEAGRAALKLGFETIGLKEIFAVVKPWNERSIRVTQRLGMKSLGKTEEYYNQEVELFRMTAEEFAAKEAERKAVRSQ